MRLKNERTQFPPNGLIFVDRKLNWDSRKNAPHAAWDWDGMVTAIFNARQANRKQFPMLSVDRDKIRIEISEQNANRIAAMPGCESYLATGPATGGPSPNFPNPHSGPSPLPAVGTKLSQLAKGAATLID